MLTAAAGVALGGIQGSWREQTAAGAQRGTAESHGLGGWRERCGDAAGEPVQAPHGAAPSCPTAPVARLILRAEAWRCPEARSFAVEHWNAEEPCQCASEPHWKERHIDVTAI